ncbi:MAG: hypothetical protein QM564_11585 [Bergeyella sp.]
MENWVNLYKEIATVLLADLNEQEAEIYSAFNTVIGEENKSPIRWLDLWHNQVNFLEDEHQFPTPAFFLAFRSSNVSDMGEKMQQISLQIDGYLFYETFADTYTGSYNQEDALAFIGLLDFINARLHGTTGENYSSMRKTGFAPEDTGNAGNLYRISFECIVHDETAAKFVEDGAFTGLEISDDFQIPD